MMHPPLIDTFGRRHNNLRISVTDRCNLRCVYCMPEDVTFLDREQLLSFEEIAAFVRAVAPLGIDKLRLTGGEPLMRKDLHNLIPQLVSIPGIQDIALTTNGLLLAEHAHSLHQAGLRRLNVSLDTLDAGRFRELSRRDGLDRVLAGLATAKALGFRIKLNAVAIRGFIEHDAVPLAKYCRDHGFELRFIEYMPIGAEAWEREKLVPAAELLELLEQGVGPVVPASTYDPKAPAMEFDYVDGGGRVGIIASISRPFCHHCNRVRLTVDGKIRNCLFALDELDVKPLLRRGADASEIQELLRQSLASKWEGHEINTSRFIKPLRTMHAIGG